jgi:hypothetical protein
MGPALPAAPMNLLAIYLAGLVATAVTSWHADRAVEPPQRNPVSCHLLLALAWPLFLAFLGCSALSAWLRDTTS